MEHALTAGVAETKGCNFVEVTFEEQYDPMYESMSKTEPGWDNMTEEQRDEKVMEVLNAAF